ncbi:hypothetical protein NC651_022401 [Populus alba x Populus x berolinensis]|nr:hypothetical protein NC651_022401 [Populus alba x Populus x berolinensis]
MIKRSPRRNPRSKGIKLKHGLQICLLLGVCFWLIYQVKHPMTRRRSLMRKMQISLSVHMLMMSFQNLGGKTSILICKARPGVRNPRKKRKKTLE